MGVAPSDLNLSQLAINGDTATLIKYLDADKELIGIKDSVSYCFIHLLCCVNTMKPQLVHIFIKILLCLVIAITFTLVKLAWTIRHVQIFD